MDDRQIEDIAVEERTQVLKPMQRRRPREVSDAIAALHPRYAIEQRGFRYYESDHLDWESDMRGRPLPATIGLVDRRERLVAVSTRIPIPVRRFTAGHELGHIIMHDDLETMHRDRQLGGGRRDRKERQADALAAAYVMPPQWLAKHVERIFGSAPVQLNDDLIFHLTNGQADAGECLDGDELARAVARYSPRWSAHASLVERFQVSTGAMAIRLVELRLIDGIRDHHQQHVAGY